MPPRRKATASSSSPRRAGPTSPGSIVMHATTTSRCLANFDSGRQIAMASRAIYGEPVAIDSSKIPDPAVAKVLESLESQAHLGLPSAGTQEPIEKSLSGRLKAVFEFDPDTFRAR